AALVVLLAATPARATPPITQGWKPEPAVLVADTSVERVARAAQGQALSIVNTGAITGSVVMLAAIPAGSGAVFATGLAVAGVASIAGPSAGWSRAGYGSRALGGALLRTGIIVAAATWPQLAADGTGDSGEEVVAFVAGAFTGVALATLEAW